MPFRSAFQSQAPSAVIARTSLSPVYALVALALALTVVGVFIGAMFALPIITSGWLLLILLLEVGIVVSAGAWSRVSPLNFVLFFAFPILSGFSVTPLLISIAGSYVNGPAILLNAAISTTLLAGAVAVVSVSSSADFGGMFGRFLLHALIGLIAFGLLQIFVPALRGAGIDMIVSGIGIVVFSLFLAVDIQRLQRHALYGESAFLLALGLYLDIFNLFLYVLRFMMAMSGRRR